jgi:hypothetical protein
MNLYYSLPFDIREKIDVHLTKTKHKELHDEMRKVLKKKTYMLFIEKVQYYHAELDGFYHRSSSMCPSPEYKTVLARNIDEYEVFLDSLKNI